MQPRLDFEFLSTGHIMDLYSMIAAIRSAEKKTCAAMVWKSYCKSLFGIYLGIYDYLWGIIFWAHPQPSAKG